jgi:DUF4097 and DUF4098 domain-containing protein YvlB
MRLGYRSLLFGIVVMTILSVTVIANERIKTFTFEGINSVNIQTASGSITICPGSENKFVVELKNDLEEPELLNPEVETDNGELSIAEHFRGNSVRGEIFWTVYVPPSAIIKKIACQSASGDMQFERIKGELIKTASASGNVVVDSIHAKEFEFSTASGSITVDDCTVDFVEASSASGDISINSAFAKELKLSVASGSITVEDCDIAELGEIATASGEVELFLPALPSERLEASSASGDVTLKVPQFGENFAMTLMKREDKGRIKCPFEYTERETIRLHTNDDYLTDRYTVKRGKGGPDIRLVTASGTIKIETNSKGK